MPKTTSSQSTKQVIKWAEALAQLVSESKMSELRLENGGQTLRMRRRDDGEVAAAPSPARPEATARPSSSTSDDFGIPVNSNYVGVFRSSHPKTGKPMVKAQDTTETNQVLGWVECMGIRYEVVAPRAGTVAEVMVDDSEPVEFGQVLLVIQ